MPFPTKPNMSWVQYRAQIIDHYWPKLRTALEANQFIAANSKTDLINDYARIGSFLTSKASVLTALLPLEREIRAFIWARVPKSIGTLSQYNRRAQDMGKDETVAYFKAEKVLSNALRRHEAEGGFNHEKLAKGTFFEDCQLGTLHSGGGFADGAGKIKEGGQGAANKVRLPSGVPTVYTSQKATLDPLAFQSILLRHGYQFKDVAAGPYHGEFTHRLQWYAIMQALSDKTLYLANTPLQIFKSLGYMTAKADDSTLTPGRRLYMWEALFDTAEDSDAAERLGTEAWASNAQVFTCPEHMNKSLMTPIFPITDASVNNESNLWCLRTLLKTRWKKRFDENDGKRVDGENAVRNIGLDRMKDKQLGTEKSISTANVYDTKTKALVSTHATVDDAGYALVWYLRSPDGGRM
jgi:hypothetical protein